eukprot:scaffold116403_cov45-Phaeocystis_antarctica.AAC.1
MEPSHACTVQQALATLQASLDDPCSVMLLLAFKHAWVSRDATPPGQMYSMLHAALHAARPPGSGGFTRGRQRSSPPSAAEA